MSHIIATALTVCYIGVILNIMLDKKILHDLKKNAFQIPRNAALRAIFCMIIIASFLGGYSLVLSQTVNFHVIKENVAYRSGQMTAAEIETFSKHFGIKSIVNLRGASKKSWYKDETAAARALGIKHIDFKMDSSSELTYREMIKLVSLMRSAPKPMLVHCDHGINRTGLAATLYLSILNDSNEIASELQLSPRYGYWPVIYTPAYAMWKSYKRVEPYIHFERMAQD